MPPLSGPPPDGPARLAFRLAPQDERPRAHAHGLLLALVVARAELRPGTHGPDLPNVVVGARPQDLVSPGLRHVDGCERPRRPVGAHAPGSRGTARLSRSR